MEAKKRIEVTLSTCSGRRQIIRAKNAHTSWSLEKLARGVPVVVTVSVPKCKVLEELNLICFNFFAFI